MNRAKRIAAAVILGVMAVTLTACYDVPSDMIAVRMASGSFEDKKPKGCIEPGTKDNSPSNDDFIYFPISEREWDATGEKGSDGGRLNAVTDDNVEMKVPVTIRFNLVADCKVVTDFYLKHARRSGVKFESDGTWNSAWITLLRKLVKQPSEMALDRIVQGYKWRDVWNDPKVKAEIEEKMNDSVPMFMQRQAKGKYFENVSVLIGKPGPKNKELAQAVAQEQTNVAKSQSARAQAEADEAKARAEVAVAQAEAAKRRAEVQGYGGIDGYLKARAVDKGLNPWQPVIVPGLGSGK